MSGDGPTKDTLAAAPEVEPLDEIILGEDDETNEVPVAPPRPPPRAANSEPPRPPPTRPRKQDAKSAKAVPEARESSPPPQKDRKRSKLTLRIPDDEVSRPQLPLDPSDRLSDRSERHLSDRPPSTPPGGILATRTDPSF